MAAPGAHQPVGASCHPAHTAMESALRLFSQLQVSASVRFPDMPGPPDKGTQQPQDKQDPQKNCLSVFGLESLPALCVGTKPVKSG